MTARHGVTPMLPSPETASLLHAAELASRSAYAPYSRLHVGAAVRSASGAVYAGCNVENAAFPLGACAEANAIGAAVLAEGAALRIAEVAISARDAEGRPVTIPPCGGCRQRMEPIRPARDRAFRHGRRGGVRSLALDELLPRDFPAGLAAWPRMALGRGFESVGQQRIGRRRKASTGAALTERSKRAQAARGKRGRRIAARPRLHDETRVRTGVVLAVMVGAVVVPQLVRDETGAGGAQRCLIDAIAVVAIGTMPGWKARPSVEP